MRPKTWSEWLESDRTDPTPEQIAFAARWSTTHDLTPGRVRNICALAEPDESEDPAVQGVACR